MCAFGEPIGAGEALAAGIVDRIIEGDLLAGAIAFAREVARKPAPRTSQRNSRLRDSDPAIFAAARQQAQKTKRGQTAPLAAIEAVEAATRLPFDEGCALEAKLFGECLYSTQCKALIHAFFAERAVSKIPGIPADTQAREIRRAAVIGAGTMGGGITMTYANAGIPVIVKETSQEALDRGMATIRKNYAGSVKKGRLAQAAMDERMARITPQLSYAGFEDADIIVEAVFEGMALKKQVFAEIDAIAKPTCILASNTSYLDIDEIASATGRPEMVLGNHFFSPANVMRLLEIVRGKATSPEAIATCMALARKLKKVGVLAGNCRGFIGNRMLGPYLREAQFLVEEGASVADGQPGAVRFRHGDGSAGDERSGRTGRGLADSQGIPAPGAAGRAPAAGGGPVVRDGPLRTEDGPRLVAVRREPQLLARPGNRGADREDGARGGDRAAEHRGREIVDRCVLALINEGAKLLEEGIALRASDIDVVYLNGYAFPAWRGGPMFYADTIGLDRVLARLEEFEARHGAELWSPAPLLKRLAGSGKTFSSFDQEAAAAAGG